MRRDAVYYVMPLGEIWLVRAIGSSAEAYPTLEDALAAAERLAARGAHVRVLSRADRSSKLARGSTEPELTSSDESTLASTG